ncbi:MAG: hypothetical protein UX19_C0005G0015 [Candidatus Woesebacteria bacterium GW2011_GWA1_45_8]|uniref:Integral membrane protein n=1 Tax=Candidatus Woesebacteria bacterium GW2011_GWA1_45_8 TaxID=1618559 RepID=A0A0G1Q3A8_9BACT|nr:MAG: hypothetical protein UX19_C0005G0015 [Candidatus Woesebacteria bacterium GW2011_GWA1_45_8]
MLSQINIAPSNSTFNELTRITVPSLIAGFISLIMIIAAVVFFFILVIGGIRWITSGGDKANTEAARSQITAALVGLVIVFAAWAIIQLIQVFFGITILGDLTIPNAIP